MSEKRKGLEGRGAGWYRGGSRGWVGASQRLTQEPCPPFTEVSRNPVQPKLQSCWPGICSGNNTLKCFKMNEPGPLMGQRGGLRVKGLSLGSQYLIKDSSRGY